MNKLIITGNLVKNPELRTTTAGVNVCGFTIAVNRRKTQNNQDPGADYFNVSAWRQLGDNCAKFLQKGSKVTAVGAVSIRTWENNGKHGASMEVTAEDVEFLSSPKAFDPVDAQSGMTKVDNVPGMPFNGIETDEIPY